MYVRHHGRGYLSFIEGTRVLGGLLSLIMFVAADPARAQSTDDGSQIQNAIEIASEIKVQPSVETPIPIHLRTWRGMPRQVIMLVRGLPDKVTLSEGRAFGPGVWAVSPAGASKLKILPTNTSIRMTPITVALVTLDGTTLAEAKSVLNAEPQETATNRQENTALLTAVPLKVSPSDIAAETPNTPKKPLTPEDQEGIRNLMEKGDEALKIGKVSAARLFYKKAAEEGSALAALALGSTYDAHELKSMNVVGGVQPDAKLAQKWYSTARDLGAAEATARLERLGQ
jgi:hypothetical protein